MRWSEAHTVEFVKLYLAHECLWNPDSPSYKDNAQRLEAYSTVSDNLEQSTGISADTFEVKRKIRNLRTTYSQNVHRMLKCSQDPDSLYRPSVAWFQLMDDKLKHIANKQHSNFPSEGKTTPEEGSEPEWQQREACDPYSSSDVLVPESMSGTELSTTLRKTKKSRKSKVFTKVKKKKKSVRTTQVDFRNYSTEESVLADRPLEDEFDIYGKHVASQLRRMDLGTALRSQMQINRIVSQARLTELDNIS